jgi:hypothetical protein
MSKTSADRRLAKGNLANLYAGNSAQGWRIIKQVSIMRGLQNVARNKWRLLQFEDGRLAGFQMVKPDEPQRGIFPGWSPASLTAKDAKILAGLYGPF